MIVVSDTSPITSLIAIGRVELLKALFGDVLVPPAVADELRRSHAELPSFIVVSQVNDLARVAALEHELDRGEAEAIVLASEARADLVLMDETIGRAVAIREHIRAIGLLGVLLLGKQRGLVTSIKESMASLESQAGFYLSTQVKKMVLEQAGETG